MNFSDPSFILLFLPLSLVLFYAVRFIASKNWHVLFCLVLISIIFYSMTSIFYLAIFALSLLGNYVCAKLTIRQTRNTIKKPHLVFFLGLLVNLMPLIYFKFLLLDVNPLTISRNIDGVRDFVLPLGISFYTFQQIALQIDCYWGRLKYLNPLSYIAFISFFPQLIAGPIMFQKELIPQLNSFYNSKLKISFISSGVVIFSIGLFKKIVIAEQLASLVDQTYNAVGTGVEVGLFNLWSSFFAFPLQVYFDFSAYCDMACGISLFFGIQLAQNFHSPFKSKSIIDFWNRWHITLMRFFRNYIYNPISIKFTRLTVDKQINSVSIFFICTLFPIMTVFLLTGIWHGSSVNFLLFGLLHGLAVSINHLWRQISPVKLPDFVSWVFTFFFVCFSFLLMRADGFDHFLNYLVLLFDFSDKIFDQRLGTLMFIQNVFENGLNLNDRQVATIISSMTLVLGFTLCIFFPNSNEIAVESILNDRKAVPEQFPAFDINYRLVFGSGLILGVSILQMSGGSNNFIYFQF